MQLVFLLPLALALGILTVYTSEGQVGRGRLFKLSLVKCILNKTSSLVNFYFHHSRSASRAAGSFGGIWGVGGAAGGAGVGAWATVGMLTNCSLMNSFNLWGKMVRKFPLIQFKLTSLCESLTTNSNVNVGSPEASVIRNCVLSAGSVSILTWKYYRRNGL